CALIVVGSASSGPLLALFAGLAGLALWRWRTRMAVIRRLAVLGLIGLHLVMKAPVWYLMARIDLAGGSTGWHRAELVSAALKHLDEWWLIGTDYTRHWIAYGVGWSQYHVDMTNYYISMGVTGGLLLVGCFVGILIKAFQSLGRGMRTMREVNDPREFILWCVGTCLFAHCVTFLSISYFDQSNITFAMVVGTVPGLSTVFYPADGLAPNVQEPHSAGWDQTLVTGECSAS
ncbi:MAG TPA: hypothetical protein VNZ22_12195, partial [Bacillota bacterium]|nr:hypothetical protein [Bacillota bacterium]